MPEKSYTVVRDGNAWCCYDTNDFISLPESNCEFGDTPQQALQNYITRYGEP
jgi:hypothetical protein